MDPTRNKYDHFLSEVKQFNGDVEKKPPTSPLDAQSLSSRLNLLRTVLDDLYNEAGNRASVQISRDQVVETPAEDKIREYQQYGAQLDEANMIITNLQKKIDKFYTTSSKIDAFAEEVDILESDLKYEPQPFSDQKAEDFKKRLSALQEKLDFILTTLPTSETANLELFESRQKLTTLNETFQIYLVYAFLQDIAKLETTLRAEHPPYSAKKIEKYEKTLSSLQDKLSDTYEIARTLKDSEENLPYREDRVKDAEVILFQLSEAIQNAKKPPQQDKNKGN